MKQFIAGLGIGLAAGAIYVGAAGFAPPRQAVIFANFGEQAKISGDFQYTIDGKDVILPDRPLPGYADASMLSAKRYLSADGYLPTLSYAGREAGLREIGGELVVGTPLDQARGLYLHGKEKAVGVRDSLIEMKGMLEEKVKQYFRE